MRKIHLRGIKRYFCIGMAVVTTTVTSGCVKFEEPEDKELYIEYAANAVLKHDKNYIDRMKDVSLTETTTESQTQEVQQETTTVSGDSGTSSGGETQSNQSVATASLNDIFSINGFDIQPAGYEIVKSYPHNGSELGMSMVAVNGYNLLVMKLNVINTTASEQNLNILEMNSNYKAIVNGSVKMNVQVTALLDAFNTWNGSFVAGEMKQLVLIFQISDSNAEQVTSVQLDVSCGERQGTVNIG